MGETRNEVSRIRKGRDHPARRQSHLSVRRTLGQIGVSRATFYRWYDRYQTGGPEALEDRPSRPSRVWNRLPDDTRQQILALALEETELSPRELAVRFTDSAGYFVSEATVYRLLKAHDLITSPAFIVMKAARPQLPRPSEEYAGVRFFQPLPPAYRSRSAGAWNLTSSSPPIAPCSLTMIFGGSRSAGGERQIRHQPSRCRLGRRIHRSRQIRRLSATLRAVSLDLRATALRHEDRGHRRLLFRFRLFRFFSFAI